MRDDERQRIFMLRTNVNEMNVQPVDLGDELRQGVELRLALAPVVVGRPIAREFLHRRERHALGLVRDRLPVGPLGRRDAPAEIDERLFRDVDAEVTDQVVLGRRTQCLWHLPDGAHRSRSDHKAASASF